ncbi:hypothetical protein Lesp01_39920 [Lentzea sp. NBRC 102530]|nr:hypothetical protein Lesp01_39920 [Lentzea sp. NBRC 102530]
MRRCGLAYPSRVRKVVRSIGVRTGNNSVLSGGEREARSGQAEAPPRTGVSILGPTTARRHPWTGWVLQPGGRVTAAGQGMPGATAVEIGTCESVGTGAGPTGRRTT